MRSIGALAVAAVLLATVQDAAAQTPRLAVEVRGSYAIPSGDWNEDELFESGFGAGATVTAMFAPRMGVYAGWERFQFAIDEEQLGVDGAEGDGIDQGFRAGLASFLPIGADSSLAITAELGAIYNTFEISASDGNNSAGIESDASVGFEAGVGLAVPIATRLQVTPSVRVRWHDVEFDDFEGSDTVQYFALGVGLRLQL